MAEEGLLVVGGCGLVGFHVVKALLDDGIWPSVQRHESAETAHAINLLVRTLLDEFRPSTVIHTASPIATGNKENWQYFYRTDVGETKTVLDYAATSTYIKAFIYTSSVSVIEKSSFDYADETAPIATSTSKLHYYPKSKLLADQYVLNSNNKTVLRTICLRITSIYGPRGKPFIPGAVQALGAGHQRRQIENNTNLHDACSVQNAATAQVLGYKNSLYREK